MKLLGANRFAKVTGIDELPGTRNYFIGNDPEKWLTKVPTYAKVNYRGVYPGVDLVYYGNQGGQLEYDFVVASGADPSAIVLDIGAGLVPPNGQRNRGMARDRSVQAPEPTKRAGQAPPLRIATNGDLLVKAEGDRVRFHKPVVYQPANYNRRVTPHHGQRTRIDGNYVLQAGNQVGFNVPSYDHSRPLIIDPVLSYSTFVGGSNFDYAYGIALDTSGSAYVTGHTDSIDFPARGQAQGAGGGTCGSAPNTYACFDAFVAKLDPTGSTLVYATFLGGSGDDHGTGIAVDSSGSVYVTGYTNSTDFPTKHPIQGAYAGGNCGSISSPISCLDAFVVKLNPAGSALVYSTYLGGRGNDIASGIAVDTSGAAYIAGSTSSTDFPVTLSTLQAASGGGNYSAFLTKLNPAGSAAVYSTYLGGGGEDHGAGIAVDSSGDAYITGYTNSINFSTLNPLQATLGGGTCGITPCFDAFVAEINAPGSALIYSTYLGGTGGDYGNGIAVDSAKNTYVTGLTTSTNFPVTAGVYQVAGGGTIMMPSFRN